jgi:prophage regulatory protein
MPHTVLHPTSTPRLERLPAVMARSGLGRSLIYAKILAGEFPIPVKLGERAVAWRSDEVDAWIESRPRAPVGERESVVEASS